VCRLGHTDTVQPTSFIFVEGLLVHGDAPTTAVYLHLSESLARYNNETPDCIAALDKRSCLAARRDCRTIRRPGMLTAPRSPRRTRNISSISSALALQTTRAGAILQMLKLYPDCVHPGSLLDFMRAVQTVELTK